MLRKTLHMILRGLGWLLAVLLVCDLLAEYFGLPEPLARAVCHHLQNYDLNIKAETIRCGLFNGLACDDIALTLDSTPGAVFVKARQARIRPSLKRLCRGRLAPGHFELDGATASLLTRDNTLLEGLQLNHLLLRGLHADTLAGEFDAQLGDFAIDGQLRVQNASAPSANGAAPSPEAVQSIANTLAKILADLHCDRQQAQIQIDLTADALRPDSLQVRGHLDLAHPAFRDYSLQHLGGDIAFADRQLTLNGLVCAINDQDSLTINGKLDCRQETFAAHFAGSVTPLALLRAILRDPEARLPYGLQCDHPLQVKGAIPETDWNTLSSIRTDISVSVPAFSLGQLDFLHGECHIALTPEQVTLDQLAVSLDAMDTYRCTGRATFFLGDQTLAATLHGTLPTSEICRRLGHPLHILGLENINQTGFDFRLERSPLKLEALHASLTLSEAQFALGKYTFPGIECALSLANDQLEITRFHLPWQHDWEDFLHLRAACRFSSLLAGQSTPIAFTGQLYGPDEPDAEPLLAASATLALEPASQKLSIADGHAHVFPDRLDRLLRRHLDLDQKLLGLFSCNSHPLTADFTLPECHLDKPADWQLTGRLTGRDTWFDEMHVHEASCDFTIDRRGARFMDIRATFNDNEDLEMDVDVAVSPLIVTMTNARVHGRPEVISNFIFSAKGKRIFNSIWRDVVWMPDGPPVITANPLVFAHGDLSDQWTLKAQLGVEADNCSYSGLAFDQFATTITLDLPGKMTVGPARFQRGAEDAQALFSLTFGGTPRCHFRAEDPAGVINLLELCRTLAPTYPDELKPLELAGRTAWQASGFFELDDSPRLKLDIQLETPTVTFGKWQVNDATLDLNLTEDTLHWDLHRGEFKNGRMMTSGNYNFSQRSGETLAILHDIPVEQLALNLSKDGDIPNKALATGAIDLNAHVRLFHNWAGQPLNLEGSGHLELKEGNLWRIPVFYQLGRLVSLPSIAFWRKDDNVQSLGTISELSADFDFQGDRVVFRQMTTNGTIISLEGTGEYSWQDNHIQFLVRGDAMKHIGLLNFLLKPLTWSFDAELSGIPPDVKWKLRTPLRKIFVN